MKSKKQTLIFIIIAIALINCSNNQNNQNKTEEEMGYISELNENVTRTKVTYKNRYGLDVTADL